MDAVDVVRARFLPGGVLVLSTTKGDFKSWLLHRSHADVLQFVASHTNLRADGVSIHRLYVRLYWWLIPKKRFEKIMDALENLDGKNSIGV
ncbi:MAG: hypothetical protein AMXMBFR84_37100 [Candidatus Hydrogenedentota bacterium]